MKTLKNLEPKPKPVQRRLWSCCIKRQPKTFWLLHQHCDRSKFLHCFKDLVKGDWRQFMLRDGTNFESWSVLPRKWIARASNHEEIGTLHFPAWTRVLRNAPHPADLISQHIELTMGFNVGWEKLTVVLVGLRYRKATERDAKLLAYRQKFWNGKS